MGGLRGKTMKTINRERAIEAGLTIDKTGMQTCGVGSADAWDVATVLQYRFPGSDEWFLAPLAFAARNQPAMNKMAAVAEFALNLAFAGRPWGNRPASYFSHAGD